MQSLNLSNPHAFILKSSSFPIFILQLLIPDVYLFNLQLTNLLLTQEFPKNSIMILDLQKISDESKIDFMSFRQNLLFKGLSLVGIIGGSEQQKETAISLGLHSFSIPNIKNRTKTKSEQPIEYLPAELITTTVRSGQKICAKNRDLICTATVNHGAEIISDGNIHVYGKLSGRALAGASGNQESSIFCTNLDAELVSIAGFYIADLHAEGPYTTPVQIQLVDEKLQIKKLTP
jgi:septum site-determining protein MinC